MVPGSQPGDAALQAVLGRRTLDRRGRQRAGASRGECACARRCARKWPLVPRKWPLVPRGAQVGVLAGCRPSAPAGEPARAVGSRPRGCRRSLRETQQRPRGPAGLREAAGPRRPRRLPGAVLLFGPSWTQRPSRACVLPADQAPLAVSDAGLLGFPAGSVRCRRACCSRVPPKARVGSRSCCADGRSGRVPSVRGSELHRERRGRQTEVFYPLVHSLNGSNG